MKLYSTKSNTKFVTLKEAVLSGLPPDNGLYMPSKIPKLDSGWIKNISRYSFTEIAYKVASSLIGLEIPDSVLDTIINSTTSFGAPIKPLYDRIYIQELWHGPSMAFKDFGARFMAGIMSYFNTEEKGELNILVATSGDTGGAVAAGFHKSPGINVIILYPKGKVSPIQESQLTTLGDNIYTIEIDGDFDDCQHLVKQAFLDQSLKNIINLSSANSINIGRLIPQSFYYFEAIKQMQNKDHINFIVPSGNLGNLTAGLIAKKMGAPIESFIVATNANDTIPRYLENGIYNPSSTIKTLANAMDVSKPSNFERISDLFKGDSESSTWNKIKKQLLSKSIKDAEIKETILRVFKDTKYILDPHTATGVKIALEEIKKYKEKNYIVLGTAHYGKFVETIETILPKDIINIPDRLNPELKKVKNTSQQSKKYEDFKSYLLKHVSRETI